MKVNMLFCQSLPLKFLFHGVHLRFNNKVAALEKDAQLTLNTLIYLYNSLLVFPE